MTKSKADRRAEIIDDNDRAILLALRAKLARRDEESLREELKRLISARYPSWYIDQFRRRMGID